MLFNKITFFYFCRLNIGYKNKNIFQFLKNKYFIVSSTVEILYKYTLEKQNEPRSTIRRNFVN